MIQKLALLAGGLGAAAVLAFALGLTNFVFADPNAGNAQDVQAAPVSDVATVANDQGAAPSNGSTGQGQTTQTRTKTVVDKVYIAPAAPPKTIHVNKGTNTQPSQAANTPAAPPVTYASDHSSGEQGEPDHERGDGGGDRGEGHGDHERGDD